MAISLSNVGPGSVTARGQAQSRRARLAAAKRKPITGPGTAGLGIGPEQGVLNQANTNRYQVLPSVSVPHTTPTTAPAYTPESYSERQFRNVDTMLFKDRLAGARRFFETGGQAFKFKQSEIPRLIQAGILSYGKGGNMKYPGLVASANLPALNSFLNDNFTSDGSNFRRKNKNLQLSDNTIQYLTYGGLDASKSRSEYVSDYSSGRITRNARTPAQFFERVPKVGKGDAARVDYVTMADQYKKDAEQEATWKSKIASKVQKEGGAALWNKIMSGKYNAQDVQNLRQYMYSPNGEYGDAQEKFIQETLLKNPGSSPVSLLNQQTIDQMQSLAEDKAKQDAKDAKKQGIKIQEMYDKNFNPALGADAQFSNLITAITGVGMGPNGSDTIGQGDYITPAMIEQVMRQGQGHYVTDSSVTGGKRFVEAGIRGFTNDQKKALIDAVKYAADKGYTIPPALVQYIDPIVNDLNKAASSGQEINDPHKNVLFSLGPMKFTEADIPSNRMISEMITGNRNEQVTPFSTNDIKKVTEPLLTSSYLQATPAAKATFTDWLVNIPKGLGRMGVGLVPGMFYLADDPKTTVASFGNYYWSTYTNWDNFKTVFVEDPLSPIMDALGLVSGVGMAFKGAQIISAASRLSKAAKPVELAGEGAGVWIPRSPIAGQTPTMGGGITRLDYAGLMRRVAAGDPAARLRLEMLLPKGTHASNSLRNPTAMDKAASFFEPHYKFVTRAEGNPAFVDQSRVPPTPEGQAAIRFAGNPLNRAAQKIFFSASMRGGKMTGRIANLPYLGFNYRFDKAMKETNLVVIDGIRQELAMTNAYHKAIDEMKLNDTEQQVVMDTLTGGAYSPAMLTAIKKRKLQDDAKGMAEDYKQLLEADVRRMTDPAFLDEYARIKGEMLDGSTPRGKELAKAHSALTMLLAKQNRLLAAFDSPATIEAALRAYAPISEAARLTARDFQRELGSNLENLAMFNPNYHLAEQLKVFPDGLKFEEGKFIPLTKEDTPVADMFNTLQDHISTMSKDQAFRDLGGNPFFIVDEVIRDESGAPLLVRGRRLKIDGNIHDGGNMERTSLIDPNPIVLPASSFVPIKGAKDGVMTMSADQAIMQLRIGSTNFLNKTFPNVRDVTDKISDRSINTTESFANRQNRNIVTMSALQDYHLKVQFDAHRSYLQRRVNEGWSHFFDTTAFPMQANKFNSRDYVALKTQKVFDSRNAAEAYAQNYDAVGAVEPGIVSEKVINGETKYVTSMRYFDTMKSTIIDQQLGRIRDTADFEKAYIMDLKSINQVNPNETLMVVPRTTYNKFQGINHRIDRALHDTFVGKSGGLLSSIFKVLTLSANPHWLPQSIVGSSMMVGMATPEMFPSVMAGLWQTTARRAAKKLGGEAADAFSHHVDDFNYFTRVDPHSFTDNIYMQDRQTDFMGKIGDSKLGKYTVGLGYTTVFAFESNLRASLYREIALKYPGFKSLMKSPEIEKIAAAGRKDIGLERLSKFQAAFEALSNPESKLYDPLFMQEVRYTADGVLGNYRDFSHTERAVRNYLIPFYAWQRHSALFTYRLFKERPLQANAAYKIGNMGFDKVLAAGGIPEWMYESIPMPDQLSQTLDLSPDKMNRLMVGSINPMSTTTDGIMFLGSLFAGQGVIPSATNLYQYTNPFINAIISQTTGTNLLTGQPLTQEEKNRGLGQTFADLFTGFPAISAVLNGFKSASELNQFRGNEAPTDVFVNYNDPKSKLSIPQDKLSEKFPTTSKAGLFNLVSPVRAVSLDAEQMIKNYKKDAKRRGISVPSGSFTSTTLMKHTNALLEWKRKADFINKYWMPTYGKSYPDVAQRVMAELAKEFPALPKDYPPELYNQVLGG